MNPFKDFKILYSLLSYANDEPMAVDNQICWNFNSILISMLFAVAWARSKTEIFTNHGIQTHRFCSLFLTKFSIAYFSMIKSSLVTRFYSHCDCVVCECVFFSEVKYKINHGLAHFTFNFFISWLCCYSSSSSFLLLLFFFFFFLLLFLFLLLLVLFLKCQIQLASHFKSNSRRCLSGCWIEFSTTENSSIKRNENLITGNKSRMWVLC